MTDTTTIKFSNADWARLDNPDPAYVKLADLLRSGQPWKAAIALSGVGYASGWLFAQRQAYAAAGTLVTVPTDSVAQAAEVVRGLRLGDPQQSWGEIMARTGLTEGSARALFTHATNVDHLGLRNGKGGRWLEGNAEAYEPAPKVGWVRPKGEGALPAEIVAGLVKAGALTLGDAEELASMTLAELKGMAETLGLSVKGNKATLAARIAEAYAA